MTEFTVYLANRPGMLAMLAEQIASAGVNIEALAAYGVGEEGRVHLMAGDAAAVRLVLRRAGLSFDEREVLLTTLSRRPGSLAAMARSLADAGVNIEALYLLRCSAEGLEFAIAVDDPQTARRHLAP